MAKRQIIKEYKVERGDTAILNDHKVFGPYQDAAVRLKRLGAVKGDCSFTDHAGDRPGDWCFGTFEGATGPYVIKPKGWSDEDDNKGLKLRIFSVESLVPSKLLPGKDLK
jgi:hypothetical protein